MNRKNPTDFGSDMREKAMSIAMKRKEEYLGARVPKSLKETVIGRAEEMGIPVSLLIRKVLEEAFAENSTTLSNILNRKNTSVDEIKLEKPRRHADDDILGWKSIEVNHDRSCERCREPLPKGSQASLGFTASDSSYVIVCYQCKSQFISE